MIEAEQDSAAARRLACEGFIFGYPIVLSDALRAADCGTANQFAHGRTLAEFAPDCDPNPNYCSVCSTARLDLTAGPIVFTLPDLGGRCFSATLLDAWTDIFASIGSHSCGWRGTRGGDTVVVGPAWRGEAVDGLSALRAPSNHVLLVVRILAHGPYDLPEVHRLQDRLEITPIGAAAEKIASNWIAKESALPHGRIGEADLERFFNRLNALIFSHPPARRASAMLGSLSKIGIAPGRRFSFSEFDFDTAEAIIKGASDGHALIQVETLTAISHDRGWRLQASSQGDDLLSRAACAMRSMDITRHESAVHAIAHRDAAGRPLQGGARYRVRFEREAPPVENFWSITLHHHEPEEADRSLRYAIYALDRSMPYRSAPTDIWIQSERPPANEARAWLPAPRGAFSLTMSFYQPMRSLTDGSWRLPVIERILSEAPRERVLRAASERGGEWRENAQRVSPSPSKREGTGP